LNPSIPHGSHRERKRGAWCVDTRVRRVSRDLRPLRKFISGLQKRLMSAWCLARRNVCSNVVPRRKHEWTFSSEYLGPFPHHLNTVRANRPLQLTNAQIIIYAF
jgi:hypothetical protein